MQDGLGQGWAKPNQCTMAVNAQPPTSSQPVQLQKKLFIMQRFTLGQKTKTWLDKPRLNFHDIPGFPWPVGTLCSREYYFSCWSQHGWHSRVAECRMPKPWVEQSPGHMAHGQQHHKHGHCCPVSCNALFCQKQNKTEGNERENRERKTNLMGVPEPWDCS